MSASPGRWWKPAWWPRMERRLQIHALICRRRCGRSSASTSRPTADSSAPCRCSPAATVSISRSGSDGPACALPERAGELLAAVRGGKAAAGPQLGCLAELRTMLAEHGAIAAQAAGKTTPFQRHLGHRRVEPGVWRTPATGRPPVAQPRRSLALGQPLRHQRDRCVPARDVAPAAAAEGRSSRSPSGSSSAARERVLVYVGQATRLTRLPRLNGSLSSISGLSHRVIPGTAALIDLLVGQLTGGKRDFDPGGRFSVQGAGSANWSNSGWRKAAAEPSASGRPPGRRRSSCSAGRSPGRREGMDCLRPAAALATSPPKPRPRRSKSCRTRDGAELILAGNGLDNGLVLRGLTTRWRTGRSAESRNWALSPTPWHLPRPQFSPCCIWTRCRPTWRESPAPKCRGFSGD